MVKRKQTYPSPVVRLAIMKEVADKLELKTGAAVLGLDLKAIAERDSIAKKDFAVVQPVVTFALQPLPGKLGSLKDLCSFKKETFADGGSVYGWSSLLSVNGDLQFEAQTMSNLETARELICGSFRAWSQHSETNDLENFKARYPKRKERREAIRKNTIEGLLKSGPRETRKGTAAETVQTELQGKKLAELLTKKTAGSASASPGGNGAVQD